MNTREKRNTLSLFRPECFAEPADRVSLRFDFGPRRGLGGRRQILLEMGEGAGEGVGCVLFAIVAFGTEIEAVFGIRIFRKLK